MGKIIFFSIFSVFLLVVIFIGGSYLIVYWRDTRRRWRIENEQDKRRQMQESLDDLSAINSNNLETESIETLAGNSHHTRKHKK